jgi:high-affinity Fe2+/Pb2+ permease
MEPQKSDQNSNAKMVGIMTAVTVFVVVILCGLGAVALGMLPDSGGDMSQRGQMFGKGTVILSAWCGLIAFGIAKYLGR